MTDTRRVDAYCRVRGSSTSSSRRAASPAPPRRGCSVRSAGAHSGDPARRSAAAAVPRRSGRSSDAANAPGVGSHFTLRVRRSPTRALRATCSRPGRSTRSAVRRLWPPSSWSKGSTLRRRTSSPISRPIRPGSSAAAIIRPSGSPGSSQPAGACRRLPCLSAQRVARPRARPACHGAERLRNARGAFVAVVETPRRVLLVDDVYTTGATVSAAATALRRAGTRQVDVVTFARTVRL